MDLNALSILPIIYVVFLLSTVCHEAAHALVAKWGGDNTAYVGGQVTLDPVPHIKREPFGLIVVPLLTLFTSGMMFGWGSAPFDPFWQIRYPRRAALMALAGPLTNFALAAIAALVMHVGIAVGFFLPVGELTVTSMSGGMMESFGIFISWLLQLNVLLGVFNLLPVPPLDGYSVLGLILPEDLFLRLLEVIRTPMYSFVGILVAWHIIPHIIGPAFAIAAKIVNLPGFAGY